MLLILIFLNEISYSPHTVEQLLEIETAKWNITQKFGYVKKNFIFSERKKIAFNLLKMNNKLYNISKFLFAQRYIISSQRNFGILKIKKIIFLNYITKYYLNFFL